MRAFAVNSAFGIPFAFGSMVEPVLFSCGTRAA
jgi:hypothetical protein